MSDPKRDKPQDRKRESETRPDRPASPLPSITAPKFIPGGGTPAPEVSVTSPNTTPEAPTLDDHEPPTNTETTLDPKNYAASADKDPDELSSDFAPVSGKQLDAGGRLVAQAERPPPAPARAPGTPAPPPLRAPSPPSDEDSTDAAVPQLRPATSPAPPPRRVRPRSADVTEPEPPPGPPPIAPVSGQRPEPGRWIINRDTTFGPETNPESEPGAFDPTVRKAAPPEPPRRKARRRLVTIAVAVAVVTLGSAAVWLLRPPEPAAENPETAAPPPPENGDPEPARIRITSKPNGAAVHINGVSLGVTPVDRESPFAPEAELEVEVLLKGYRPWTRRFHAGQSVAAHAQLKPAR
ncbi:MAG TPA: PEGA domain-containing protein [Myxococcaceae bacterium]|nr:PEGA domain-containing protein [Myxococcaceae bacterium]